LNTINSISQYITENSLREYGFSSIDLSDVEKAQFMRRIDSKYILPLTDLEQILYSAKGTYSIVENNGQLMPCYNSVYFDTPDLRLYLDHHNRRAKRYKIRTRHYLASNDIFLELKIRIPTGEILKNRLPLGNNDGNDAEINRFISSSCPISPSELTKTLATRFNRITLVSPGQNERVTIDFNLLLSDIQNNKNVIFNNLCIIETKRNKYSPSSMISEQFKRRGIRETSFSKYSVGIAILHGKIKCNNFKPIIHRLLNNYSHEYTTYTNAG